MTQLKAGVYYKKRMGDNFDFPLAVCFGSRDWLGSEGADELVRGNKFFGTGES